MVRLPALLAFAILSGACGESNTQAPSLFIPFPVDSGIAADTSIPSDLAQPPDTSADAPSNPMEAGSRDGGPMPEQYGTCGRAVHTAVCACDRTDTACNDDAFGTSMTCSDCIADAQAACCPAQSDAFVACAQAAGCTDLTCAQARCPSQVRAYLACITTQWEQAQTTMTGSCYRAMVGCLGSYPVACGG